MAERCIREHCTREVGTFSKRHHPLSCGSQECDVYARGYAAAERDIAALAALEGNSWTASRLRAGAHRHQNDRTGRGNHG